MNVLAHHRKVVRFIECDSIPLFEYGEVKKMSLKQTSEDISETQEKINRALGIDDATFLKHFKDDKASSSELSESQKKINAALGISPELFKKWNH